MVYWNFFCCCRRRCCRLRRRRLRHHQDNLRQLHLLGACTIAFRFCLQTPSPRYTMKATRRRRTESGYENQLEPMNRRMSLGIENLVSSDFMNFVVGGVLLYSVAIAKKCKRFMCCGCGCELMCTVRNHLEIFNFLWYCLLRRPNKCDRWSLQLRCLFALCGFWGIFYLQRHTKALASLKIPQAVQRGTGEVREKTQRHLGTERKHRESEREYWNAYNQVRWSETFEKWNKYAPVIRVTLIIKCIYQTHLIWLTVYVCLLWRCKCMPLPRSSCARRILPFRAFSNALNFCINIARNYCDADIIHITIWHRIDWGCMLMCCSGTNILLHPRTQNKHQELFCETTIHSTMIKKMYAAVVKKIERAKIELNRLQNSHK